MPVEPGTRLGPYEVLEPLGGAADERYKASDTRKHQVVALKILPPELASHPELKARLERDTRTISSLNHPQICAVVDVGHEDPSTDFVVTELVEGETLAERLTRGPLDQQEALKVASAIADSLDKAHRRDVVHGGLNPSVVMLTSAGPKLMDFGVANVTQGVVQLDSATIAPTRTSLAALSAVPALGAPYMAPEQFATGAADATTDIYSLGAILYEMVTGRKPFEEQTQALLIAAVQTVAPEPASRVRPGIPPALEYVITRCLSKDPKQRFQTAFDVLGELQWVAGHSSRAVIDLPVAGATKTRERVLWLGAGAAAVVALALVPAVLARFERTPQPDEARFVAATMPAGNAPITLSPDGRWLTATINDGPVMGLSLDSVVPQTLVPGTPFQPFWSADSRSIAYFEEGKLKRIDIGGGPPQIICDVGPAPAAGTWNRDGVILFPAGGLIQRVLAAGGQPAPITALDESRQETEHLAPWFLPDGRRFLFLALSSQPGESAIYVASLDSAERTRLFASESRAAYAAPGYLLFSRGDTVFAQAFDAETLALSGEPVRVASGVPLMLPAGGGGNTAITRSAGFAVSQTGILAYRTGAAALAPVGGAEEQRTLYWIDRSGQQVRWVGSAAGYTGLDLSPDGTRVALHRHEGTGGDIWLFDFAQERMQRLTFDVAQDNASPIWSPDGTRVAFASRRGNQWGMYVKPADGSSTEELIVESETQKVPMSWSPDGKLLVYVQESGGGDVWAVPTSGDKKPVPLLQEPFRESFPQVSPDGKWIAYHSNETGRFEVYVRPFPQGPGKWQVSTDGGTFPRWRGDGRELYFFWQNRFIAADIRPGGSSVEPGVPRPLFTTPPINANTPHLTNHPYAVTADGRRFLASAPGAGRGGGGGLADRVLNAAETGTATTATGNPVTVVVNWTRMVAANRP